MATQKPPDGKSPVSGSKSVSRTRSSTTKSAAKSTTKTSTPTAAKTPLKKAAATRSTGKMRVAKPKKAYVRPSTAARIRVLLIAVAIVFSVCGVRAMQIQAFDPEANAAKAADLLTVGKEIPALRGAIVDRSGTVLAMSENSVTVVADPQAIAFNGKDRADQMTDDDRRLAALAPQAIAEVLARNLGKPAQTFLPGLTKAESRYAIMDKNVSSATYIAIRDQLVQTTADGKVRRQPGISSTPSAKRSYPGGSTAANVIGFVDHEGVGKGGLELTLNSLLSGTPGREEYQSSPNGRIPLGTNVFKPSVNGDQVNLTIDAALQTQFEKRLAVAIQEHYAAWGVALAMNPKTGEILALAQAPSFNPNDLTKAKTPNMGARAVTDAYEPGSVQKALTFAALVDKGLVKPEDVTKVPSRLKSGGGFIKDAFPHGEVDQTARSILSYSSNIGTVLNSRKLPKAELSAYLKDFGLGAKTNIGLPGETAGMLPGPKMEDYTRDQISFGQALSVNVIQEAAAVAAVINGGVYHAPRLIASTTSPEGTVTPYSVAESRRVLKEETSAVMRDMLESVLTSNHVNQPNMLEHYRAGGKTGTAEKISADCGCYRGEYVTSFAGFAPAEDPEILIYVVWDTPRLWGRSGAGSPVPLWKELMEFTLPRYGVAPSTTTAEKYKFRW